MQELALWAGLGLVSLWPVFLVGSPAQSTPWIWLGLWAPVAGALSGGFRRRALAWGMPLLWAVILIPTASDQLRPFPGLLAAVALFLAGWWIGGRETWGWGRAAACLVLGSLLALLPSGGGIWSAMPGATWVAWTLDLSPVVWVAEHAGLDWMRHVSVYEKAGAGDLGPHERVAWSGSFWPAVACALLVAVQAWRSLVGTGRGRAQP